MAPSSSRNGAQVIWIAVHTAEGIRRAADLKAFFDRSTNSSAHACADDAVMLDNCVPYDRAAWTLRNGNPVSDNLELCGFAAWSRDEWLRNHQGMLNHAAGWMRARCLARGIPIRKIDAAAVGRREAGVIGHIDYTRGTGDGTHWDPGPGFPWDVVIARAAGGQQEEQDMSVWDELITKAASATDPRTSAPAGEMLRYANQAAWEVVAIAKRNEEHLLAAKATQAAILAELQDDVSDTDVLALLAEKVSAEMARWREEAAAARAAEREALVQAVRDSVPAEWVDTVLDQFGQRLTAGGA